MCPLHCRFFLICTWIKSLGLDGNQPIHNILMYLMVCHISDFILYWYGWAFKWINKYWCWMLHGMSICWCHRICLWPQIAHTKCESTQNTIYNLWAVCKQISMCCLMVRKAYQFFTNVQGHNLLIWVL